MPSLTGKQILDTVLTRMQDDSDAMRGKLLVWLSAIMRTVLAEREWFFVTDLKKSADLPIAANVVALPADFEQEINIRIGTDYFFDRRNVLTDEEAFRLSADYPDSIEPKGYQVEGLTLTFSPGIADGTATVKYYASITAVADDETDTIWPDEFLNLFVRGLLSIYYEWDKDQNIGLSVALDQEELDRCIRIDNRRQPMPKYSTRGYLRSAE